MTNGKKGMLLTLAAVLCISVPTSGLCSAESAPGETGGETEGMTREWAVYIYCGADNDYEEATIFALDQCAKALADENADPDALYVIALLDKKSSEGTWVFEVTPEDSQVPVSGWSDHERNSSNPDTLTEFLDFAMDRFPGEKTLMVMKNGHAWCGVCPDSTETNEKWLMPLDGLAGALLGRDIDVLALDGDNMASIEAAYELRGCTDYFVGTQQDIPLDGLPYYLFVKEMAADPSASPVEVASSIVYNYVYYYNNTDGKKNLLDHLLSDSQMAVTAAAFYMGEEGEKMDALVARFSELIEYMMDGVLPEYMGGGLAYDPEEENWTWVPDNRNNIASARDSALIGKMADQAGYEWLPDVYQWFKMLEELVNYEDPENDVILPVLVDAFHADFNDALIKMEQCQILNRSGNSWPHGLNIWFPPSWTQWESLDYTRTRTYLYDGSNVELPAEYYCVDCPFDYNDIDLDFVEDTPWMDFFELYYESRWVIYGNPEAPRETPLW